MSRFFLEVPDDISSVGTTSVTSVTTERDVLQVHISGEEARVPRSIGLIYGIVHKTAQGLGNGSGGPIYGEMTIGSAHKVILAMMMYTGLGEDSKFVDVGCGVGKMNFHVAQYPGVEFSYGIEIEHVRWFLGCSSLNNLVKKGAIANNCHLDHGDVNMIKTFSPMTHVYQFDIG